MPVHVLDWWQDFLQLLFPRLCPACQSVLPNRNLSICLSCQGALPYTHFHKEEDNPFTERFWGRIPLHQGSALLYFVQGGRTQQLIHQLKYKGRYDIGLVLGQIYGQQLRKGRHYVAPGLIIPVPLHPKKQKLRTYNQAEAFGRGLAQTLGIPLSTDVLIRIKNSTSQTKKGRMERYENVEEAFRCTGKGKELLSGCQRVLLVDDVLTTGATLEACAQVILQQAPTIELCFLTIAIADH